MNAFGLSLMFAARGSGGDGAGAVLVAILSIIVAIMVFIAEMNKAKNAVWRSGGARRPLRPL